MATWFIASLLSVLSALLAASVWMHLRLRAEFRALSVKTASVEDLTERTGAMAEQIANLQNRIQSVEEGRTDHSEWISQAESLNLNRRGQVLRLHRRGDSVSEIASALRVGQGEVRLMIKVHEICRDSSTSEKSSSRARDLSIRGSKNYVDASR